jgi:hypothetical protein
MSVAADRRRAIWRSAWTKLRYRRRMESVASGLGRNDGRLTPNNTDQTIDAYVRWPLGDAA